MRISDWSSDVCSSDLTLTLSADGTFDTFNPFNAKGTAGAGGTIAVETLMVNGDDEAFTMYGLLAETIEWPEDRSWIIFHLNPKARWHDGEPVTADDVIFSFRTLVEKGHPQYRFRSEEHTLNSSHSCASRMPSSA